MRYLPLALVLAGSLLSVTASGAAMKKLRSWPAAVPVPSAALKEQYEYDPAAGAVNSKLLRMQSVTNGNTFEIRYTNGVPSGGHQTWNQSVIAYHGFTGIMNTPFAVTEVLKYKQQGAWPASALDIYSEHSAGELHTKTIFKCQRVGAVEAGSAISALPGKLYKYQCKYSAVSNGAINGTPVNNQLYEFSSIYYYSDYLDTVAAIKYVNSPTPMSTTSTLDFIDASGTTRSASFVNENLP
ncbi:hypothetical protein [Pseudomonas sp. GV071]|uniref:hypothetical protein n=1 Tax=Pseudomonas sp. GV071 TaxID=2135754 RepID=UPI000D3CD8BC|nr:hypothetical protein [Pseudomonas sp. GV071]PTQ67505.1 hypothetical protein C8K61_115123 [Pseudomonas sp. GV071]